MESHFDLDTALENVRKNENRDMECEEHEPGKTGYCEKRDGKD